MVVADPVLANRVHPVRSAIRTTGHRRVASGALDRHARVPLQFHVADIVIAMRRREFSVGRSMAGGTLQTAMADRKPIKGKPGGWSIGSRRESLIHGDSLLAGAIENGGVADLPIIMSGGARMAALAVGLIKPAGALAISGADLRRVHSLIDNYFVYSESILYGISGGAKVCEAKLKKTVYLSPYGDVQFCYTVPFCFGNIRSETLGAIISRMYSHDLFKLAPADKCPMNDSGFKEALRGCPQAPRD